MSKWGMVFGGLGVVWIGVAVIHGVLWQFGAGISAGTLAIIFLVLARMEGVSRDE